MKMVKDYRLCEVLGSGGMGTVFRAVDQRNGAVVAIKVMAQDAAKDDTLLRRFEKEYQAANRLDHPNIVRGLEFGVEAGHPYLVMEFVEGENLVQYVRRCGPLSEIEAIHLLFQLVDALQLAHEHKLLHRDIKPDNILLTPKGQVKLTDLGLVKDLEAGSILTRPRTGLGTVAYVAPEQFENANQADARSDVYGLGGVLYFMVTGAIPFPGRGNLTVMAKKLKNDFASPRKLVPSLSPKLDEFISQCLNCSPERRPASCAEVMLALQAIADSRAATAASKHRSPSALPSERRRAMRFPSLLSVNCRPSTAEHEHCQGLIEDISRTGLCLYLDGSVGIENHLILEVVDAKIERLLQVEARVQWVRALPEGCRCGCSFTQELSDTELNGFFGDIPPTVIIR